MPFGYFGDDSDMLLCLKSQVHEQPDKWKNALHALHGGRVQVVTPSNKDESQLNSVSSCGDEP